MIATVIHILVLLSANHDFCILEANRSYWFVALGVLSLWFMFGYLTHEKKYDVYNFEQLFYNMGGETSSNDFRESNPKRYFTKVIEFY